MGKKRRRLKNRIKRNERKVNFAHDPTVKDNHHLLWIGANWNKYYYAKLLRNYWYCQIYIPKNTLHKSIHNEIHSIPIPSETTCRYLYNELLAMEKRGELSPKDNIVQRLQLLISLLGVQENDTSEALYHMLTITKEFYNERPP